MATFVVSPYGDNADEPSTAHGVVLSGPDVGIDDPFAPPGAPSIGCYAADASDGMSTPQPDPG